MLLGHHIFCKYATANVLLLNRLLWLLVDLNRLPWLEDQTNKPAEDAESAHTEEDVELIVTTGIPLH